MQPADAKTLLKALELMSELELVISEFYRSAGDVWKEDRGFWSGLAEAEITHAENIKKMSGILIEKPHEFGSGRPFNAAATQTATAGIHTNIQRLKSGGFNKKEMLFTARDIEQALLESKYAEIMKTTDAGYLKLVGEITAQTEAHKMLLDRKIAALP